LAAAVAVNFQTQEQTQVYLAALAVVVALLMQETPLVQEVLEHLDKVLLVVTAYQ
jgi:hypothetical protein